MEEIKGIFQERRVLLREKDKINQSILALRTQLNQRFRPSLRRYHHLHLVRTQHSPALLEIAGQIDSLLIRTFGLQADLRELDQQIARLTGLRLA